MHGRASWHETAARVSPDLMVHFWLLRAAICSDVQFVRLDVPLAAVRVTSTFTPAQEPSVRHSEQAQG